MIEKSFIAVVTLVVVVFSNSIAHAHCPVFGGGLGIAGPVTAFSAPTLPQGKWSVGLRTEYVSYDQLSATELDRSAMEGQTAHAMKSQLVYSLCGAYGITDDLTVGLSLPYVQRDGIEAVHFDNAMGMMMVHDVGDSNGIGDLTVFAQYRFVRKLYEGIDASLLAGLKTPTGVTDNTSGGQRIGTEHQPGSGSWDPFVGLALSKRFERFSLHAGGAYTVASKGTRDTNLGDRAQANLAVAYRFGGKADYGECDQVYEYFYPDSRSRWLADLVLELNGQWQDKAVVSGVRDDSWGGTLLYLSPGARVIFDNRYSASVSVGVPVYQHLNGNQSKADYRVIAGFALGF